MAFAWVRTTNLLANYFDNGEAIIGMTMTRFTRDRDEFRRLAPPRTVVIVLGTIDVVETIIFFIAAIVVLIISKSESPPKPMRLWIAVYAIECVVHLAWLYMQQYQRQQWHDILRNVFNMSTRNFENGKERMYLCWWTLGCYWLLQSSRDHSSGNFAPLITWMTGILLFFDILVFFCAVTMASILGLVLCCFLPLVFSFFYILGEVQDYDGVPACPFCECSSSIHKSTVRFM